MDAADRSDGFDTSGLEEALAKVEADVVAEPANETAVTEADADDEAPSTEPEVEVAEYAYDDGRGTSAYYGEVRAEYQAPSPSEPEQEPEAPERPATVQPRWPELLAVLSLEVPQQQEQQNGDGNGNQTFGRG